MSRRTIQFVVIGAMSVGTLFAESHKEYRFTVGPKAGVSVNNPYGSISVKPSVNNTVVVNAVLHSNKVEVDNSQNGNRLDIQSHLLPGADANSGRVDYELLVPPDASVTLHSTTGPLRAEKLHGDLSLEGAAAMVDVRDISDAHVHVKTLNGPVTLSNVRDGHVEIDSLSGEVTLNSVTGPLVQVVSTSGKIVYLGDFGSSGEYRLTSHSGDIEATVPASTSADVSARSVRGEVEDDIPLEPKSHTWFPIKQGSAFVGTMGKAASSVVLRTFSGKIHLKKANKRKPKRLKGRLSRHLRSRVRKKRLPGTRKGAASGLRTPVRAVFLVGFMGAGKSSVGRALGQRLNWLFEDLDDRIAKREGRTVPEIFRISGEGEFRRAEREALQAVLEELSKKHSGHIVALGGGAFVQSENAARLNAAGVPTVFLDAPVAELWRRCRNQVGENAAERPLLGSLESFSQLYEARRAAYAGAFMRVDTGDRTVEAIADEIAEALHLRAVPAKK
jgi:shikimate kinase